MDEKEKELRRTRRQKAIELTEILTDLDLLDVLTYTEILEELDLALKKEIKRVKDTADLSEITSRGFKVENIASSSDYEKYYLNQYKNEIFPYLDDSWNSPIKWNPDIKILSTDRT